MLILSIVLAAMAPVMTTRNKTEQSSPWKYSEGNLSDAYYGLGESQTAMIGQREFETTDETAKLIINSSSARPSQISFKNNGTNQGLLRVNNNSILLGSLKNGTSSGSNSLSIGSGITNSVYRSVAIGLDASSKDDYSVAIGSNSSANCLSSIAIGDKAVSDEDYSIAIGVSSNAANTDAIAIGARGVTASGESSIAIGSKGDYIATSATGQHSIAIGDASTASGSESIALGLLVEASGSSSTAVGNSSSADGTWSSAYGYKSDAGAEKSVAIGSESSASGSYSIALGANSSASGNYSVSAGNNSKSTNFSSAYGYYSLATSDYSQAFGAHAYATGSSSLALGYNTTAQGTHSIAIGSTAQAKGDNNVALGTSACAGVTGSNKICIGANSGPSSSSSWATDSTERIFIGSKSKFNDGAAVLEVHNGTANHYISKGPRYLSETAVVVNGSLIVKGPIMASIPKLGSNAHEPTGSQLVALFGSDDGSGNIRDAHNSFRGDSNSVENYFNRYGAFKGVNGYVDNLSDRRLKYVGSENISGLEKIRELKVFNYTFKKDKKKTPHVGVIAQDLQKIFPDAVSKGKDGFLRIRMEDMFYAVINSIKELDARVTALEKENKDLKQRLEKLEAKLK